MFQYSLDAFSYLTTLYKLPELRFSFDFDDCLHEHSSIVGVDKARLAVHEIEFHAAVVEKRMSRLA